MLKPVNRTGVVTFGVALLMTLVIIGCVSQRRARTDWTPPPVDDTPDVPGAPAPDPGAEDILAAVQSFLERTAEYQKSVSAGSAPAVAAAPAAAPRSSEADAVPRDEPSGAVANAQVTIGAGGAQTRTLALPVVLAVSFHDPSVEPAATPAAPFRTNAVNVPITATGVDQGLTPDRFLEQLESQAVEDGGFDAEWRLRVALLAMQRDDEAMSVSGAIPEEARALLRGLFRVAAAVRRAAREPMAEGEEALAAVESLHDVLADRADPQVTDVALCRKVVTFGVYEEMAESDFVAGRTTQTIVYSEVRRFKSERSENGQFRTRLATRLEVLTADGKSIWQHEEPEIVDLCQRRRTDFFIAQRVNLPPTIPAGEYVIKVRVEDKLSGRADEAKRPFTISSPLSMTQR